jgi:N-acetylglucosamine malate deacetylase 1
VDNSEVEVVLAVGAHPDDIEFMMAGTLLLLGRAGASLHMWNMTDGSLGSVQQDAEATAARRYEEAGRSARIANAVIHPPIAADMRLARTPELLARATAVIRTVRPTLLLVHSPADYHPDHEAACGLAVSSALLRAMGALASEPPVDAWNGDLAVYHASPFGLRAPLRAKVRAGQWVDIASVMDVKRQMLAVHSSQIELLRQTQGDDPLCAMERMAAESGRDSGRFKYSEGWRRRLHIGLSAVERDPLSELLGTLCVADPGYEAALEDGTAEE